MIAEAAEWDVFISHASEDKDDFVRLLAHGLEEKRLKVWFDEFTLRIGDSLRRSIDDGVVPENSIRADSRDEGESAHHPGRCLHAFSCLGCLSPTCSGRGASLKSRTSFFAISSILL